MTPHPLDNQQEIPYQSAIDVYRNDIAQVSISEHLHAVSSSTTAIEDRSRLQRARYPHLFASEFDHIAPGPRDQSDEQIPGHVVSNSSDDHRQASPDDGSPVPSLDSRQMSLTDSSLCTDDQLFSHMHDVFHLQEGNFASPTLLVIPSDPEESDYEIPLATSEDGPSSSSNDSPSSAPSHLRCAFWFLGCRHASRNESRWLIHCNQHLKNRHDRRPVKCQFCSKEFPGWTRWLRHIADHQRDDGINMRDHTADPDLLPRLWCARILQDHEYLDMLHKGKLRSGRRYIEPHDPRLERRRMEDRRWKSV